MGKAKARRSTGTIVKPDPPAGFDPDETVAPQDAVQPEKTTDETSATVDESAAPEVKTKNVAIDVGASCEIVLELGKVFPGYATRRVDFTATRRQAAALKILWSSLCEDNLRYDNGAIGHPEGRQVDSGGGALRYLLDKIADAIETDTDKSLVEDFNLIMR